LKKTQIESGAIYGVNSDAYRMRAGTEEEEKYDLIALPITRCLCEDAVRKIQSGQRVFLTGNCSTPQTVLAAMVKHSPNLKDVEICLHKFTLYRFGYTRTTILDHLRG
jgi:hypothetical protein